MGRKKKSIISKINPEKSNKMIYAVVVGLAILFVVFFILISGGTNPENKQEMMTGILGYLNNTQGIIKLEVKSEENLVRIFYDSQDSKDFFKIAAYAGIKLSLRMTHERVKVVLYKDNEKEPEIVIFCKDGSVMNDKSGETR
jgi:hypothetical protein